MKGHRTCNYRWHFTDFIPFTKRMRMTIENYGPNGQGPRGQYDYSSTAFWYQAEPTPPFAELRGVKYTGGDDPAGKPTAMEYNPHAFPDLNAEIPAHLRPGHYLRPAGRSPPGRRGEDRHGQDRDRRAASRMSSTASGRSISARSPRARSWEPSSSRSMPTPSTTRASTPRRKRASRSCRLENGGRSLPLVAKSQPHVLQLGGLFLTQGRTRDGTGGGRRRGRAIFDCLQLEPAARFSEAIEAEELTVVRATGGAATARPSDPIVGVSAGRVLRFRGEQTGQGFVFNLGKRPALPYVLGVRPLLGPNGAIIQAFVGDQPIGPQFDLYAATRQLGPSILPLGPVPAERNGS